MFVGQAVIVAVVDDERGVVVDKTVGGGKEVGEGGTVMVNPGIELGMVSICVGEAEIETVGVFFIEGRRLR